MEKILVININAYLINVNSLGLLHLFNHHNRIILKSNNLDAHAHLLKQIYLQYNKKFVEFLLHSLFHRKILREFKQYILLMNSEI